LHLHHALQRCVDRLLHRVGHDHVLVHLVLLLLLL
jgi:hypothetical protein